MIRVWFDQIKNNILRHVYFSTNTITLWNVDIENTPIKDLVTRTIDEMRNIMQRNDKYTKFIISNELLSHISMRSAGYSSSAIQNPRVLKEVQRPNTLKEENFELHFDFKCNVVAFNIRDTKIVYYFVDDTTVKKALDFIGDEIEVGQKVIYKEKELSKNIVLRDVFNFCEVHELSFDNIGQHKTPAVALAQTVTNEKLSTSNINEKQSTSNINEKPATPNVKRTTKKQKIPATVRNVVWNTYIGKEIKNGSCFCCNTEAISIANFECGHIVAEVNGGEQTVQNLRPICSMCNKSMGTKNMEDFMKKHGFVQRNLPPIDDFSFLETMNCKQLRQICMLLNISHNGTKDKLIKKIRKKNLKLHEILDKIDKNKKFLIICNGIEKCNDCSIIDGILKYCDKCDEKDEQSHVYYTNEQMSRDKDPIINEHKKIRDGITECKVCKKNSYMEEYENAFI